MNELFVTATGADDKTNIEQMLELSKKYKSLEFAILLREGDPKERYPSIEWIQNLYEVWCQNENMKLAGHVCGRWVREICEGNWKPVFSHLGDMKEMFSRIQLNFSPYTKGIDQAKFRKGLDTKDLSYTQFIFQLKDINDSVYVNLKDEFDVVPLFDISGGRGISPKDWPVSDEMCGYAGGLSDENAEEQVRNIKKVAKIFYIDAETGLRTDGIFDLEKVEKFYNNAQKGFE